MDLDNSPGQEKKVSNKACQPSKNYLNLTVWATISSNVIGGAITYKLFGCENKITSLLIGRRQAGGHDERYLALGMNTGRAARTEMRAAVIPKILNVVACLEARSKNAMLFHPE